MKKILKSIAILSLFSICFSSCMISKPSKSEDKPRTITVSGTGEVTTNPDLVSLHFLVKTTDWNVEKAVSKNAVNSDFVFNALKENGVDINDISTFDYQVYQDNSKDLPGQYTVKNTIAVIIRNPEITGKVIDSAVKTNAGANGLTSFKYEISDHSSALRQARTLAIQNAQDAASLLAGASGCKIGRVLDIREDFTNSRAADGVMLLKSKNTQIKTGTMAITSNVTITYELEN